MKIDASKLTSNPQQVYRHADLGGTVEITHKFYPDKVFELTARERRDFKGVDCIVTDTAIEFFTETPIDPGFAFEEKE